MTPKKVVLVASICIVVIGIFGLLASFSYNPQTTEEPIRKYVLPKHRTAELRENIPMKKSASVSLVPVNDMSISVNESKPKPSPPVSIINMLSGELVSPEDVDGYMIQLEDYQKDVSSELKEAQKKVKHYDNLLELQDWVEAVFAPEFNELLIDIEYFGELQLKHGENASLAEIFPTAADVAHFTDTSYRFQMLLDKLASRLADISDDSRQYILKGIKDKWNHQRLFNELETRVDSYVKG